MLQAREKFDNVAIGDKKARAEYEAELTANIDESANRLQRENEEVAVRANEHWLQRKWEDGVEERMKRCREQNQDGALPIASKERTKRLLSGRTSTGSNLF